MSSELRFEGGGNVALLTVKPLPRARVMRLRVDPRTGAVVLTVPRRVSSRRALEWAAGKRNWIEAVLAEIPVRVPIVPGSEIPYRGVAHVVEWRREAHRTPRIEKESIVLGGPEERLEGRLLRWLTLEAKELLERETREIAAAAGISVTRVGVGDPVSRWGSCSSSGSVRYSWRLILAPDSVRRATVAHEVAHRVHMNHSREFHALVAELFGSDPAPARQWLRRHGAALHRLGTG